MPRLVRLEGTVPLKIDPNLKPGETPPAPNVIAWPRDEAGNLKVVSVCTCGLSARFPLCDGAHKGCKDEEAGYVYRYDPATRAVVEKRAEGQ